MNKHTDNRQGKELIVCLEKISPWSVPWSVECQLISSRLFKNVPVPVPILILTGIVVLILGVGGFLVEPLFGPKHEKVMVVVAKHDYPKGSIIIDPKQMFELREFRLFDVPVAAVSELNDGLRDLILRKDIHEGQPLEYTNLETEKGLGEKLEIKGGRAVFNLDPPAPGKQHRLILAKAREGSIQVGTCVDVIQSKSKEDPKAETIVLHDVLVRTVRPVPMSSQEMLDKLDNKGKTDLVALYVIIDLSAAEEAQLLASLEESKSDFVELRPSGNNKKVDEKNSRKIP